MVGVPITPVTDGAHVVGETGACVVGQVGKTAQETRTEPIVETKHVVKNEHLAIRVGARANPNDPSYKAPAGGVDVCNVQVPIRRVAAP